MLPPKAKKFTVFEPKGGLNSDDIRKRAIRKGIDGKLIKRSKNEFVITAQGEASNMGEFETWLRKNFGRIRTEPRGYKTMSANFTIIS